MSPTLSCPACGSARLERVSETSAEFICAVCRSLVADPKRATILARLRTRGRKEGPWSLVGLATDKVLMARRYHVFTVSANGATMVAPPAGVDIDDLNADDLAEVARFVPPSELARRKKWGERGIVARVAGRPVGCVWLAPEPRTRKFPVPIALASNEIYADGLYVRPGYRGSGTGTALSAARRSRARRLGYSTIVAHTYIDNHAARKVQAAQDGTLRETVLFVVLLGRWRRVWRRDAREVTTGAR